MINLETVSIERLFRIDGDIAMVTGGGNGIGRIASMTLAGRRRLPT